MKTIFTSALTTPFIKFIFVLITGCMITTACKANPLNFNTTTGDTLPQMAINLLYRNGGVEVLADGVLNAYDPSFHVGVADEDAEKMIMPGEDVSIMNTGIQLSLDARPLPQDLDTLFLSIANLTKPQYTLQIFTMAVQNTSLRPFLIDRFLGTTQPLLVTDTNRIVFNTTPSVPQSYSPSRFVILFRRLSTLPITMNSIKAIESNNEVKVQWQVTQDGSFLSYDIERSANGIEFTKVGNVMATANDHGDENYSWLDKSPNQGNNYYRIRIAESDGKSQVSKVVQVSIKSLTPKLTVYPNPVRDNKINVQSAFLAKGNYILELFNTEGQAVFTKYFSHPGGALSYTILTALNLSNGVYSLRLTDDKNERIQIATVLVQK